MSLTLEQIVAETRQWPPERVGELVVRLTEDLHASEPETEAAWKTEIDRRIEVQRDRDASRPCAYAPMCPVRVPDRCGGLASSCGHTGPVGLS